MTHLKDLFYLLLLFALFSFQSHQQPCSFQIIANQVTRNQPESFTVVITNDTTTTLHLHGLVVDFYIDDYRFYGLPGSLRFIDSNLTLAPKEVFRQTIQFDSMYYGSFFNETLTAKEMREKIKKSESVRVRTTMDIVLDLNKPRSPNRQIRSNVIRLESK